MVLIGDVHVMPGPDIITDVDRKMTDDARAPTDEAPISDTNYRVDHTVLSRHHSRRERHLGTNHRSLSDVDEPLVHDRSRRKAHDASGTECAESPAAAGVGTNGGPARSNLIEVKNDFAGASSDHRPQRSPTLSPTAPQHGRHATLTRVSAPTATVSGGELLGLDRDGVQVFKGITYARAERFRAASPNHESWSGQRDATAYGPQSLQVPGTMELLLGESSQPTSEDCLTLNVFRPESAGPHPVLVWIHGGAFTNGAGSVPWYDGTRLARDRQLVVVTINYRLGAFGFLGDLNLGIGDQLESLRWVQREISAFGGDPTRVTIMGESAGGSSVVALMAAPETVGLFHAAIALSPSIPQIRNQQRSAETVAELLDAARVGHLDDLAGMSAPDLLEAQGTVLGATSDALSAFSPTAGGQHLPASVLDAAAADPRPLMIGTTRDEMHLFTAFDPQVAQMDLAALEGRFSSLWQDPNAAIAEYQRHRADHSPGQIYSAMRTDAVFRRPAHNLADARRALGHETFMYWFTFSTPVFGGVLGSCHALDIPFALNNLDRTGVSLFTGDDPKRVDLAEVFSTAVANFTNSHDPGWTSWDEQRSVQLLDLTTSVGHDVIADPEVAIRDLWNDAHAR